MSTGAEAPHKFFFVHLQKTAGTSLLRRLKNQFPEEAIYPDASDGKAPNAQIVYADLAARWAVRHEQIQVITGHFPYAVAELLGGGFTTLTVLRDPVERTLSYLRHHGVIHPADKDMPLEEVYDDDFRFVGMIHNHMTKMFSMTPDEVLNGAEATMLSRVTFTPEHLERAKANLAKVDVIGLQDEFDVFCDELRQRFGWDLGGPVFANPTPHVEVSDQFRRQIAEDNAYDMELYAHAVALAAERAAAS